MLWHAEMQRGIDGVASRAATPQLEADSRAAKIQDRHRDMELNATLWELAHRSLELAFATQRAPRTPRTEMLNSLCDFADEVLVDLERKHSFGLATCGMLHYPNDAASRGE